MENFKNKKPFADKSYLIPQNPVQTFFSLFMFILLLLPNYIWAGIKYLTQTRKDVRGQVVLVSTIIIIIILNLALPKYQLDSFVYQKNGGS